MIKGLRLEGLTARMDATNVRYQSDLDLRAHRAETRFLQCAAEKVAAAMAEFGMFLERS
jgi:hypothetical protein